MTEWLTPSFYSFSTNSEGPRQKQWQQRELKNTVRAKANFHALWDSSEGTILKDNLTYTLKSIFLFTKRSSHSVCKSTGNLSKYQYIISSPIIKHLTHVPVPHINLFQRHDFLEILCVPEPSNKLPYRVTEHIHHTHRSKTQMQDFLSTLPNKVSIFSPPPQAKCLTPAVLKDFYFLKNTWFTTYRQYWQFNHKFRKANENNNVH